MATYNGSWIVTEPAVVNASPLIFLSNAGLIELIQLAGTPLFIPKAVIEEIEKFGPSDPTVLAVKQSNLFTVVDPEPTPPIIERWDLGVGETSVLTWAYNHSGTVAILDDLAARRCANLLDIRLHGTLGLILLAKRRQIIPEAKPVLEQLRKSGMYLSDQVISRALKLIGE
jgi:predicted nucleic acid-binding protein